MLRLLLVHPLFNNSLSPVLIWDDCGKVLKPDIGLAKHSLCLWLIFSTQKLHLPPVPQICFHLLKQQFDIEVIRFFSVVSHLTSQVS